jgi:hypothetical protein
MCQTNEDLYQETWVSAAISGDTRSFRHVQTICVSLYGYLVGTFLKQDNGYNRLNTNSNELTNYIEAQTGVGLFDRTAHSLKDNTTQQQQQQ